jgi:putative ABC transport system permease protein
MKNWIRYFSFHRRDTRMDAAEEVRNHLELRIGHHIAQGMSPDDAKRAAEQEFGNRDLVVDEVARIDTRIDQRAANREWWHDFRQDAVFALRQMQSRPTVAAAIVLTLALGIGATTSIFSVVNTVLLRPFPVADSDRLVYVTELVNSNPGSAGVGHYHDWAEQNRTFDQMAAFTGRTFNLNDAGDAIRISGLRATPSYFRVAYAPPVLGRYFREDETQDSRVAVLSYPLWQTRYQSDSAIVGKQIALNGEQHTVVGVSGMEYVLSEFSPRVYVPLGFTPPEDRNNYGSHFLTVMGKLKAGVTIGQARDDIARITADIARRNPDNMRGRSSAVVSMGERLIGDFRRQLWVLFGAVTLVLLIGCGNVASLLLARASSRRKEIAIRGALGGSRRRLVRQLLTESLMLALVGGAAGVGLAYFGIRFLVSAGPQGLPRLTLASLDPGVLVFALGITVLCGILFGLTPALRATRVDLQTALREGGRGAGGMIRDRVRSTLIVGEIAVALVLLVSAGLLLRSAQRLQQIPSGFDGSDVTMMRLSLPGDRYADPAVVEATFLRIVEGVRAIPGVASAGAGTRVPMWGPSMDMGIIKDGNTEMSPGSGHVRLISAGYMEALGFTLRQGRLLRESDLQQGAPQVVVVNEAFVRQFFPDSNALGKRISGTWTAVSKVPEWREIVGVVADVRAFGLENDPPPETYFPMTQTKIMWGAHQRTMAVIARVNGQVPVAQAMREAVRRVDPTVPLFDVQTMDDVMQQATSTRRFNTQLLSLLGLSGLILAAIGIYGVIAFFVTQRTHEIGVRIALGATGGNVVRMVVRQAVTLALIGVTIGGIGAWWATQSLRTMLFQVDARDPLAYALAALVLVLVAATAATLPARRAAKVDPVRVIGSA